MSRNARRGGAAGRSESTQWRPRRQRPFAAPLLALSLALAAGCGRPARGPSVLLITIDTCRADRLGFAGRRRAETPNLDRLARRSTLFRRAYASCPLTLPSHTSIFTGLLPAHHGVRDNGIYALTDEAFTLADLLKERGYGTGAFVGGFPLARRFGLAQSFDRYDDDLSVDPRPRRGFLFSERRGEYVTSAALEWVGGCEAGPLFLWAHFFDPHAVYDPPEPYAERAGAEGPYGGEVSYVDACIGRLLAGIAGLDRPEPFLIVVTSDHGEGLGDHGEKTHGIFLYDETVRVPLLIRDPTGRLDPGIVDGLVRHVDLLPTIADLLGLAPPAGLDGASLLPVARGEEPEGRSALLESFPLDYEYGWSKLFGGVRWPEKWIEAPVPELYDLEADPGEGRNLAAPGRAMELRSAVAGYARGAVADPPSRPRTLTEGETRRLRALGYLGGNGGSPGGGSPGGGSPGGGSPGGGSPGGLLDPKDAVALATRLSEAQELAEDGRYREAEETVRDLLERNPANSLAHACLANVLLHSERLEEAAQENARALGLNPSLASARRNLARIRLLQGRGVEAVREYREALRLEPDSIRGRLGLARALLRLGRADEARREAARAGDLDPTDYPAQFDLGELLLRLGEREGALAAFERSVRARPSSAEPFLRIATVRMGNGDLDGAARALERARALFPGSAAVWSVLGNVRYRQGRQEEALEAFRRAEGIEPHSGAVLNNIGRVLLRLGRLEEAREVLDRARRVDPRNPAPLKSLGILDGLTLGNRPEGRRWLQAYLEQRPDDEEARALLERLRR